jgi:hypothetical protein
MSRIVNNNNGAKSMGCSNTHLTGLLLFGLFGFGALSIAGCESSTPPAEPLAEVDLPLNNSPIASPLSNTNISSLPSPPYISTPAPDSTASIAPSAVVLAPRPKPSYVRPTTAENGQFIETKEDEKIKYSDMTMTLYKVADGNMRTEPIDEEAFE